MSGKPFYTWTPELVDQLRTLWADKSIKSSEIYARLRMSVDAVGSKCRDLGLKRGVYVGPEVVKPKRVRVRDQKKEPLNPMAYFDEAGRAEVGRLFLGGMTATQISIKLGAPTRNVVIGVLTRMGLSAKDRVDPNSVKALATMIERKKAITVAPKRKHAPPTAPEPIMALFEPVVASEFSHQSNPVGIMELRIDHCRYMSGDGDKPYCGARVNIGTSWCEVHHRIVFRPNSRTRSPRMRGDEYFASVS